MNLTFISDQQLPMNIENEDDDVMVTNHHCTYHLQRNIYILPPMLALRR